MKEGKLTEAIAGLKPHLLRKELNVRDYAEGKSDWIDAGLQTESEHKH